MKESRKVILLFLLSLGYRILHFFLFANKLVASSDATTYITYARRFASGNFYGVLDTYWSPLYPILVGIVTCFTDRLLLPAIIVSVITGSLAAPLTYYLVKQSYGQREAFIAGIIAVFFPYLLNSTFGLGTENPYLIWITGALILGWRGLISNSAKDYFFTGILVGLAYLTRPEAIGYLLFFIIIVFCKHLWQRNLLSRAWLTQISVLLLGFVILAAPYIFYLRSETGSWTVSGKTRKNFTAMNLVGNDDSDDEDDDDESKSNPQFGKVVPIKFLALQLRKVHEIFTELLPFFLIIFAALGLFKEQWSKKRFKREIYLISFCFLTVIGYVVTVPLTRYFYVLLPIFFGWIALGIVYFSEWFSESVRVWLPKNLSDRSNYKFIVILCLIFIFGYMFSVNFYVRSARSDWRRAAYEERDAGLWLKENGKPSAKILSITKRPVFYAEGIRLKPNSKDTKEILSQIKENKIDYVIVSQRSFRQSSFMEDLELILQNNPEFESVYQKNPQSGYNISIYKVK